MRRQPTPAERKLWLALRNRQVDGLKFRRQVRLGPHIVDFYFPAGRLAVEVDGATHADPGDAERDAWLIAHGYRVLHVWNNDVMANLPGVLEAIQVAARSPLPLPPAARGGG